MDSMNTDLTFFTNEPDATLLHRFRKTFADVQYLDILVGYFRTSGFHLLYDALEDIEKIRILVGLSVDRKAFELIDTFQVEAQQLKLPDPTHAETKAAFADQVTAEMEYSPDSHKIEIGVRKFIEFLKSGKLEIKAHPSRNIHAKVYIQRFVPEDRDYGRVVTGSSNFSHNGLKAQYEFNVELKTRADVNYALEQFEALWAEAVDLSEQYIDTINQRTWLNDQIKPYELYLKFLYEYFKEEINDLEDFDPYLPPGFMNLEYQKEAVISAKRILDTYNGVFLADVVGLGKTFISALLAQQLDKGRILIICPPVLREYWEETFRDFGVRSFTVESRGMLHRIIQRGHSKYKYVFIDESHRFRNDKTQEYEDLHKICWGKKIILVSATPFNNGADDIFSQLKLFQAANRSTLTGVPNLEKLFRGFRKRLAQFDDKDDPEYLEEVKDVSREIRMKVLNQVMVRRTRHEIEKYYEQDIKNQGLFFPKINEPERIIYQFDPQTEMAFTETIALLKAFRYSRYMPRLYLDAQLSAFEVQSQRNIGGFMKGLLVKRLESSFFAFWKTLERVIASYDRFIRMFDDGSVYISKKVDVYDLMERDDEEEIQRLIEEDELDVFPAGSFKPEFRNALVDDRDLLKQVQALWKKVKRDPKREKFVSELKQNPLLKNKKAIIFTESSETASYLYGQLNRQFPDKVMYFTSGGGTHGGREMGKEEAKNLIEANYNPSHEKQVNSIQLLITTDVLAEGINLHRSNIVINYDLPWNPTRVLQRVGRVNRVGTKHSDVYVFNFFPTSQSDEHLGLEANIISKIQAFHDMLGEDAKYLSDTEEVSQHDLRGQVLYRKLNNKDTFEDDEEMQESDLRYLQIIRDVRDNDAALFERLKRLPKKARAGWHYQKSDFLKKSDFSGTNDQLITFFRVGLLKKFFVSTVHGSREVDFFDAVDLMRCEPETAKLSIPKVYFELLQQNKGEFGRILEGEHEPQAVGGGHSHTKLVLKNVRSALKDKAKLTDDDEDYLRLVRSAFDDGRFPRRTSKRIMDRIKKAGKALNSLKMLVILRDEIDDDLLYTEVEEAVAAPSNSKREVILSAYLQQQKS